ncbi:hypothetical protein SBOR_7359 [Sclerotinia borealis F-4128]|uniref:Isochorismatase-like domain-containing protein n=1 Tax=Sclerotinia borealis (strain F-4128) TaxID=1432307 RepID=W9C8V7_SCLBF|nr:hypothetical protein SBOR_7359 [Sclerotinia borealis F-4128]
MEGSNGPSVYQQIVSSPINIHTNSSAILPIVEPHQFLSKVHTNGDASVASDKIYDEIDELKFEIKTRAATAVVVANTKPTKSRRSSFLSKLLNFHRNPPRSISMPNHCQTLEESSQKNPVPPTSPKTIDENDVFMEDYQNNDSPTASRMDGQFHARPYNWPHDASLDKSTTALVIIDMQKDFASDKGYLAKQGIDNQPILDIVPKVRKLLNACRANGFPIYHTREGHRPDLSTLSSRERFRSKNNASGLGIGDMGPLGRLLIRGEEGHEIIDELAPLDDEQVIDKPGRSAFQHTEFRLMLNIKGIKNLIICGVTTDVCVTSTMREANDNNFDCVLVEDACAAGVNEYHRSAVESITEEGGIFGAVTTMKNVLEKLGTIMDRRWSLDIIDSNKSSELIASLFEDDSDTFHQNPTRADQLGIVKETISSNDCSSGRRPLERIENKEMEVTNFIDDGTSCPLKLTRSSGPSQPIITRLKREPSSRDQRSTRGLAYVNQKDGGTPVATKFGSNKLIRNVPYLSDTENEGDGRNSKEFRPHRLAIDFTSSSDDEEDEDLPGGVVLGGETPRKLKVRTLPIRLSPRKVPERKALRSNAPSPSADVHPIVPKAIPSRSAASTTRRALRSLSVSETQKTAASKVQVTTTTRRTRSSNKENPDISTGSAGIKNIITANVEGSKGKKISNVDATKKKWGFKTGVLGWN